jgi:endonuclease/exonuclease/phosphatase family metal-dependent hydrolase
MRSSLLKRLLPCAILTTWLLAGLASADEDRDFRIGWRGDHGVTVMTRNMYFGASLGPAFQATTVPELIAAVTQIFAVVNASDVVNRIDRMAEEIADARPDLIGLQEVALWRTQAPADFSPTPNAATVVYDFLQILLDALAVRGEHYVVVGTHVTNDLEAPSLSVPGFACCVDVRLTDREVLLVRAGNQLKLSNVQDGTFVAQAAAPVPGSPTLLRETRGWLAVDVKHRGDQFRFITTHLLPEGPFNFIQVAQGAELVTGPANTPLPVILACDCNSLADNTGTATYGNLLAAGFDDSWVERHPSEAGLTCCEAEYMRYAVSIFDRRLYLILVRGRADVTRAFRTGVRAEDRTDAGLWPSDHAGVVATIELR